MMEIHKTEEATGGRMERIEDKLDEIMTNGGAKKGPKRFNIPFRARVGRTKLRQGYVTLCVVGENNEVAFRKEMIQDGTIKLNDTYHAAEGDDVLTFKGKPFIILAKKSQNPCNPNDVKNTTYGDKQIMSRMLNETLNLGKRMGIGMSIGALIIIGVIAYAFIAG